MRRAPRPATRDAATAAKALAVAAAATVAAVALTFVMAGPAVATAQAPRQAPAAPAKVKYYVVPPPGHGSVPTLYSIAAATLGNGSQFMEIFNLNKGRLQPNGQRLESPRSVEPGWILLLPPGASGPGVHFGPLPTTAKATSRVVHQHRPRSQATDAASPAAASAGNGTGPIAETVIGGALLVFAVAALGLVVRRRRRPGGGSRRRMPAHASHDDPGGDWVRSLATDIPGHGGVPGDAAPATGGPSWAYADHPSWPASDPGRPATATADYGRTTASYGRTTGHDSEDWAYSDHPSWPANSPGGTLTPDHPSWPASDLGPPVGAAAGHGWAVGPDRPGWPYPDHPSWPANDLGRPVADGGHPSWPADGPGRPLTPDHPSWPANDLGRPVGDGDYPGWPANDVDRPVANGDYPGGSASGPDGGWAGQGGRRARPGGPPPGGGTGLPRPERLGAAVTPAVHHDQVSRQLVPQVPPARGRHIRVPAGYSGGQGTDGPADDAQRWSAQLARTTGPIPQTYYDLAFGDGRLQVVLTEAPGTNQGWGGPATTNVLQLTGPDTGQRSAMGWQSTDPGSADSVRLAQRILSDADQQAAEIRLEAAAQAAAIREAAEREAARIREKTAADAAPIREGAEREAAEIKELAAVEAAAIREAAEREAAELRAHLLAMSAELARVAAYVTENLASPPPSGIKTISAPVLEPAAEPGTVPSAQPTVRPDARPATAPRTRPATRPGARPATKTSAKPKTRQFKAMRRISVAASVLVLFVAVAGATEIGLHGFRFFVFRSAGTGATNGNSLQENQGPGQPGAPGTHHPQAAQHATGQHHSKAKSHGKTRHRAKAQHGAKAAHGKSGQQK